VTRGLLHAVAESRAPFLSQAQGFDLTFQYSPLGHVPIISLLILVAIELYLVIDNSKLPSKFLKLYPLERLSYSVGNYVFY
jgi:hypothetical protein